MSGHDLAVIAGVQLAILVSGAVAVWAAYQAGYQAGWTARRELDPMVRIGRAIQTVGRAFNRVAAQLNRELVQR